MQQVFQIVNNNLPNNFITIYTNDDLTCYAIEHPDIKGKIVSFINNYLTILWEHVDPPVQQEYIQQERFKFKKIDNNQSNIQDQDFDHIFYAYEYPDVLNYDKYNIKLSIREKLFNHYLQYGRKEGRFKSYKDQINTINIWLKDIYEDKDLIKNITLTNPKNILENVCLLTTDKEIQNKQFDKLISNIYDATTSNTTTSKIDFNIVINNISKESKIIIDFAVNKLKQIFKDVHIINLKLNTDLDMYSINNKDIKVPSYGLKSGPNFTFIQSIKLFNKYNTTLFIETDCLLSKNWLTRLYNYTKASNGFLISGSIYDGKVTSRANSPLMLHLNGGTSLCATGDPSLHYLITVLLDKSLKKMIHHGLHGLAYDYALKLLLDYGLNSSINDPITHSIWKFINKNYIPNKLIINYSTVADKETDEQKLQKQYNYAILHKKL